MSLDRLNSRLALALLTLALEAQMVSLYSSWVSCPCIHLCYSFLLCLNLVRTYLLIHAGLLSSLLDCLHSERDCSWAWRRRSLKIIHLSWTLLISRTISNRILLKRSPEVLLFTLFPPFRILNSLISWSLQPQLPPDFTSPTSASSYEVHQNSIEAMNRKTIARTLFS